MEGQPVETPAVTPAKRDPGVIYDIVRLWAPLVIAIFLIVYGIVAPNLGWVAAGCSALGVPLLVSAPE